MIAGTLSFRLASNVTAEKLLNALKPIDFNLVLTRNPRWPHIGTDAAAATEKALKQLAARGISLHIKPKAR